MIGRFLPLSWILTYHSGAYCAPPLWSALPECCSFLLRFNSVNIPLILVVEEEEVEEELKLTGCLYCWWCPASSH